MHALVRIAVELQRHMLYALESILPLAGDAVERWKAVALTQIVVADPLVAAFGYNFVSV
jgi:hypothetical protein